MTHHEIRDSLQGALAMQEQVTKPTLVQVPGLGRFLITPHLVRLQGADGKSRFLTPANLEGHILALALRYDFQETLIYAS